MISMIFDIDDTLYDRLTPFGQAYDKIFGGRREIARRPLFAAFIKRGNEVFEDSMSGKISMEEMYIYRIRQAMNDFREDITREEALAFQAAYLWEQNHIRLSSCLIEMLNDCQKKNCFLGIITNGTSQHQRQKYHALQLDRWIPESAFLASGDAGINKPDLAIFRLAEQKMHLDPDQTWYIGDSYRHDIQGAHAAGWHTVWLDKEKRSISMQSDNVSGNTVHSEEELSHCIKALTDKFR